MRELWSPGGLGLQESKVTATKIQKILPGDTIKEVTVTTSPGKTVWDWASLVGVPLSLFALGYWVQKTQQQQQVALVLEQRNQAESAEKEAILQTYFDQISALLLDQQLVLFSADKNSTPEQRKRKDVAVSIIHARTLSILRRFESDGEKKASVIWFLKRAKVTTDLSGSLSGADLTGAHLSHIFLGESTLTGAKFNSANLYNAFFEKADLAEVEMRHAHCHRINFRDASLYRADLSNSDMTDACFSGAKLHNVKLVGVKLHNADLCDAQLYWADLSNADLTGANLRDAILDHADLSNIKFDLHTQWPQRETLAKAKKIPNQLKKNFGIE
ncbi:MAG: pentapeptide repeat-containing protein [Cyanobacteria bacterium J06649_4]